MIKTAETYRQRILNLLAEEAKEELKEIEEQLELAVKSKTYCIHLDYEIKDYTKEKLKELGFKVEIGGRLGERITTITY